MWYRQIRYCTPTRAALVRYPWLPITLLIQQVCFGPRCVLEGFEHTQHLGCISQHTGLCACRCSLSSIKYDGCLYALLQKLTASVLIPVCNEYPVVWQLMFVVQQHGSMCEVSDVMRV